MEKQKQSVVRVKGTTNPTAKEKRKKKPEKTTKNREQDLEQKYTGPESSIK